MDVFKYMVNDEDTGVNPLEPLCSSIGDGISRRLAARKVLATQDSMVDTWDKDGIRHLSVVAGIVHEGLQFLLIILAWKILPIFEREWLITDHNNTSVKMGENKDEAVKSFALSLINRLLLLIELCFE